MNAASIRRTDAAQDLVRRIDWSVVWIWLLGFGSIAYLGLKGGGYDPLVHDQFGIAVWWVLLAALAVGALPRLRVGVLGWSALALLAAFVAWTALSLIWTESAEQTWAELALVATYLGFFALALFSRDRESPRRLLGAVAAGIAFVALAGLLSRLHPAWFPDANQTGRVLEDTERLSYPINYWNGLAALVAMGLPLLLHIACCARSALARGLAAASLPALILTVFFTLSRGGIAASFVAVAIYLAFAPDRLPKLLGAVPGAVGGAILVAAANSRDALQEGLTTSTAHQQGNEMLGIAAAVCVVVGAVQVAGSLALSGRRPAWSSVPRKQALIATVVAAAVVLIGAIAIGAFGRAADGWDEFKEGGGPGRGTGRLGSVAGQNRYQFWSSAARENAEKPLIGTGSGTFEFWWARDGDSTETVRDAHSLYMQTLGELGIVGIVLLAGFLLAILAGGAVLAIRSGEEGRALLAAALAGCAAFCLTAVFDWTWQIPVLPVALLLLASIFVSGRWENDEEAHTTALPVRLAAGIVAIAAIIAIAIPLASTSLVRQSEAKAREGDLAGALEKARSAQNAQPDAASPRLQEALVLEAEEDFGAAAAAARAATERESTNWRTWLVLSRIEAEDGRAAAAVRDYRRARSLNPRSILFTE